MIKPPDHVKRFHAAKARFLQGALNNFFKVATSDFGYDKVIFK